MVYTKATKYGLVPKRSMSVGINPDIPSFDLSKINVTQIAKDLSTQINQKQPKGWLRKWWANQKLPMDNQRLSHLRDYINEIQRVNGSITDMQAELFVQPQILQSLIEKRFNSARYEIELQIKNHEREVNKLNEEMRRDRLNTEMVRAEVQDKKSNTKLTDIKAIALKKMIEDIDFKNPTPEQVFLMIKIFEPNAPTDIGEAIKKPIYDEMKRKMEQETDIMKSKAKLESKKAKFQERFFDEDD